MNLIPFGMRNRYAAFSHDLLVIPVAWFASFWMRFNFGSIPEPFLTAAVHTLPLLMLIQGGIFWVFGLYRGVWRFASLPDLIRILRAVFVGVALSLLVIFLWQRLVDIPRSVFPVYAILLVLFLGGSRLLYRWFKDHTLYIGEEPSQRVLIVGAERSGEMLVRDLLRDPMHRYAPIAFVHDARDAVGRSIHGVMVEGTIEDIPVVVRRHDINLIIIALPNAAATKMRQVVEVCEDTGVEIRTIPPITDILSGHTQLTQLREVSIEDLLGREPVHLEWEHINATLSDRVILVTGGGGSIGSELCRQLARISPARLVIFEHSEFNLYQIERELRGTFPNLRLEAVLGDVTDGISVEHMMSTYKPEVVFHAAAYKHVPMLQEQVREAVNNNVVGTHTLASAAHSHGVEIFVLISTDKAVNPTNIMGATKRSAEIVCQHLNRQSNTRFITVRFGNVLGSAGSVVPLFREQIARGGPVTVTHADITRYFMTIPEACQLIMQASALGEGGEIFVLDMGEPVKIMYLAEQMIRLSGKEPGRDIDIVITGLRPGEKLYEELFHANENLSPTQHEKILLAHHRDADWALMDGQIEAIREGCSRYDAAALKGLLDELVPEHSETALRD